MIQMDANTRELEKKKKTETWDIVYIIVRGFYITLLRVRFLFIYLLFCEQLITLMF